MEILEEINFAALVTDDDQDPEEVWKFRPVDETTGASSVGGDDQASPGIPQSLVACNHSGPSAVVLDVSLGAESSSSSSGGSIQKDT